MQPLYHHYGVHVPQLFPCFLAPSELFFHSKWDIRLLKNSFGKIWLARIWRRYANDNQTLKQVISHKFPCNGDWFFWLSALRRDRPTSPNFLALASNCGRHDGSLMTRNVAAATRLLNLVFDWLKIYLFFCPLKVSIFSQKEKTCISLALFSHFLASRCLSESSSRRPHGKLEEANFILLFFRESPS